MEDVYTIKVRTKPDTRNVYPSERRYSASTVSGLAWVHIALAATSFLLACLALINPTVDEHLKLNNTQQKIVVKDELVHNLTLESVTELFLDENVTEFPVLSRRERNSHILVLAPSLLTIFALSAGIASIMASVRWYLDHNITWLFIMSILSTVFSFISFVMVLVWFIMTSEGYDDISEFYKERLPHRDYFIVNENAVVDRNESHLLIAHNITNTGQEKDSHMFTKRVLSINILIAAFLEFLWSILSSKIAYKGMRSDDNEDDIERRGNCISVVTTIKGNNTKNMQRNGKLIPPKSDLMDHYPNKKIKRIFLAQSNNGFYLKNQNGNDKCVKPNTETSSEFYKERMMNYLNRCALEGISNSEMRTPSVQSEAILNPIPEVNNPDVNIQEKVPETTRDRITPVSWGDTPDHTIYNQNTINFENLFKFASKKEDKGTTEAKNVVE